MNKALETVGALERGTFLGDAFLFAYLSAKDCLKSRKIIILNLDKKH